MVVNLSVVFQCAFLLMQPYQNLNMGSLIALAINFLIQNSIIIFVSGDLLMLLIYNFISMILSYTTQMSNAGLAEILMQQDAPSGTGILNMVALDIMASSIIQLFILAYI
jgi:hypothetical protein